MFRPASSILDRAGFRFSTLPESSESGETGGFFYLSQSTCLSRNRHKQNKKLQLKKYMRQVESQIRKNLYTREYILVWTGQKSILSPNRDFLPILYLSHLSQYVYI